MYNIKVMYLEKVITFYNLEQREYLPCLKKNVKLKYIKCH